jgi:hypothetical protein
MQKPTTAMKNKTTYSLLVSSEEKVRSIFEGAIYGLVILCIAFSGWQFASSSVALPRMPANNGENSAPVEMVAKAPVEQPVVGASRS